MKMQENIGALASNNVVNDINKYAEQKEHFKDLLRMSHKTFAK